MKKTTLKIGISLFSGILLSYYFSYYWHWSIAILILPAIYLFYLIFLSDHIDYDPAANYQYNIPSSILIDYILKDNHIEIHHDALIKLDTCFIPIIINSSISGKFVDPYIELNLGKKCSRQYFERNTKGIRFINISGFLALLKAGSKTLKIKSKGCNIAHSAQPAIGFTNEDYLQKTTLILSPHADDAELAAFGYYKQSEHIFIATITAGESEADQYLPIAGNRQEAALLKGKLRSWDSIAVPLWAGKKNRSIQLGYACSSLGLMSQSPNTPIASKGTGKSTTQEYRQYNPIKLDSDKNPLNTWSNLISDLKELIENEKPQVIITPHCLVDSHSDHQYVTRAIVEVCDALRFTPTFLCYANHYHLTDQYPFGLEHSDLPLPPHFSNEFLADRLFSFELTPELQREKILALQMMHDLQRPLKFKKMLRRYLQRSIGRSQYPYGKDEYFRKAIRNQELFWVMTFEQIKLMTS